jgi:hypothetical protein
MAFDIKKFKEQGLVHDGQRGNLFTLDCADLPRFAFLVKSLEWTPGHSLNFTMLEDEGMVALEMLTKIRDDKLPLTVRFFPRGGPAEPNDGIGFTVFPRAMKYTIVMDWDHGANSIATWQVECQL